MLGIAWAAGLPALGGVGTASALAKFYQAAIGSICSPLPEGVIACDGALEAIQYHGASSRWHVRLDDGSLLTAVRAETAAADPAAIPGGRVRLTWSRDSLVPLAEA